ncbi:SOS response-associated peptidase family protein [Paracoccus methylarcula]|uniref:SOS response-associated peptidase family protein n=1 Tax=Paracoccus methylarcula TaxID=72022 RepID=UPI001B86E91C|nr:SOS response-associated peptidase family protein [Paracoccus methylarcula]
MKDGETTDDLYAFLTCQPNDEVKAIHPRAMPVILTEQGEWEAWMNGAPAVELQRPLPDGLLELIEEPN